MSEPAPKSLDLVLPATHHDLRLARNLLRRLARFEALPSRELESLLLVSSELLANAVDHGGGGGALTEADLAAPVTMTLRFALVGDSWRLRVEDQGGADPASIEGLLHPDGPPDLEDERGRGFFLLAELVDQIAAVSSADGRGVAVVVEHRWRGREGD